MKTIDKLLKIALLVGILGTPLVLFGLAIWKIHTNHGDEGFGLLAASLLFILFGAFLLRITQAPKSNNKAANAHPRESGEGKES